MNEVLNILKGLVNQHGHVKVAAILGHTNISTLRRWLTSDAGIPQGQLKGVEMILKSEGYMK